MRKNSDIIFFVFTIVILHYLIELIYRVTFSSIVYDFSWKRLERTAINMSAYHLVFNIFQIPALLVLRVNIKSAKTALFINLLFVGFFCVFWMKAGILNNQWQLQHNVSLFISSLIIFIISIFYLPRFMKG